MVVEEEEREIVESVGGESAEVSVSELDVAPKFWSGGALFGEDELLRSRSGGEVTWREKGREPLTAKKRNFCSCDLI
jgi:hypothetical protein